MGKILAPKELKGSSSTYILAVNDIINVINGKWKAVIISSLLFGKKRYGQLLKEIPKINPKMLSKELRELESSAIVTRTVYGTIPVTVEYELTTCGYAFRKVLDVMLEWGLEHRQSVIRKEK